MDHSRSTARETYQDGKAQEGTLNKIWTHSEILKKRIKDSIRPHIIPSTRSGWRSRPG